jgi:hypothetical protein
MGLVIPTTSLSDSPTWKTWTLEEALVSGIFNIGGNAATVQIIYGTQGSWHYEDPVNLAPGSYTVKRTPSGIPLIGLRAYNAVSGQVAVIDAVISGVYDPELNVNSLSTVNAATPYQPLIYQWPTASIAAGGSAAFDLSAPYYGQASLTVLNTTNTNIYAVLYQYDTSLTQVGVSYFTQMNGITATGFSEINQQVYIPPGRTRLQITNLGTVGGFYYASLTANPKTLAVS